VTQTERPPHGGLSEIKLLLWSGRGFRLPLPAPVEQTHHAEAAGKERECGGEWRRRPFCINHSLTVFVGVWRSKTSLVPSPLRSPARTSKQLQRRLEGGPEKSGCRVLMSWMFSGGWTRRSFG
jgi:hypothetical protein